jgi:putative Mg2+ transporter-C (MgtC) family protein
MSPVLEPAEIALRLALAVVAGFLMGLERGERGRAAGLRTHLLVCLAASVAMLQANLLLPTRGRAEDSFVRLDPMRLPLGILTGMGFIGGGAILKRSDLIVGITTAASLWVTTVIGLCVGGGQYVPGVSALALALAALWGLRRIEERMPRDRRATLILRATAEGPSEQGVRERLERAGYRVTLRAVTYEAGGVAGGRSLRCDVRWRARPTDSEPPAWLDELARSPGLVHIDWQAQGE